jgi:hypothetical protein
MARYWNWTILPDPIEEKAPDTQPSERVEEPELEHVEEPALEHDQDELFDRDHLDDLKVNPD